MISQAMSEPVVKGSVHYRTTGSWRSALSCPPSHHADSQGCRWHSHAGGPCQVPQLHRSVWVASL